jgi:hypothetical protein
MRMGTLPGNHFVKACGFTESPGSVGTLRISFDDGAVIDFENVPYRVFR